MAQGSPLAWTRCRVLESDPGMLGPSELMRRPGAGGHSLGFLNKIFF